MHAKSSKKWRILSGMLVVAVASGAVLMGWQPAARAASKEQPATGPTEKEIASVEAISSVFRKVAQQVTPAVVHIQAFSGGVKGDKKSDDDEGAESLEDALRKFFQDHGGLRGFKLPDHLQRRPRDMPRRPGFVPRALGSGMIVDAKNGYVLTNNHVVKHATAETVTVFTSDRRRFSVEWVRRDEMSEVAVLKLKSPKDLHEVALGDSDKVEVGDLVLAVGSPFGQKLRNTVTFGIVSAKGRSDLLDLDYEDFIQTDAAINPGNSGGPLVNLRGEVIGINTAIASATTPFAFSAAQNAGVGFTMPSNLAKWVMTQLIEHKEVVRGYLGVVIQSLSDQPGMARTFGLEEDKGVVVSEIRGAPARKAGMKLDDVILAIDGKEVINTTDLQDRVARIRPQTTAKFKIWRDGKAIDLDVTIGKQPEGFRTREVSGHRRVLPEEVEGGKIETLGITVEPLTETNGRQYGWKGKEGGLLITDVEPRDEADRLGLEPGDLILKVQKKEVNSVEALRKMTDKKALSKGIRIYTKSWRRRAGGYLYLQNW